MAFNCPAKCGKRYLTKEHAEIHADAAHKDWRTPRQKGWVTPHGFVDFAYPVTYEEACAEALKFAEAAKTMFNKEGELPW